MSAVNYMVSGSGSGVDGTYSEDGTYNGYPVYTMLGMAIVNKGGHWAVTQWGDPDWWGYNHPYGNEYYRSDAGGTIAPLTGWHTSLDGSDPAPTVTNDFIVLPPGIYIVSGAGSNETNGSYTENGTSNGKPKYTYGYFSLYHNGSQWVIESCGSIYYINWDNTYFPPKCNWNVNIGTPSTPTIVPGQTGGTLNIVVAGAGTDAVNGFYSPNGDYNGKTKYSFGSYVVAYSSWDWFIGLDDGLGSYSRIYSNSGYSDTPPLTNWSIGTGMSAPPSLSEFITGNKYRVSNAGSPETNGVYSETGGMNGKPCYFFVSGDCSTKYLFYTGSYWVIGKFNSGSEYYYYTNSSSSNTPPLSGWSQQNGTYPAPNIEAWDCYAPYLTATNITFNNNVLNSITCTGWTESLSGAAGYVVKMTYKGSAISKPAEGSDPTASTIFVGYANGDVVYNGTSIPTNLTITGLVTDSHYDFKIFSYNTCAGTRNYNDGVTVQTSPPASFEEQTGFTLPTGINGTTTWGDYNNDGYLDILATGGNGATKFTKIYKNTGTDFVEQTGIVLPSVTESSAEFGDYNNDGFLDILITGYDGTNLISKIYKNNGNNTFTKQTGIALTGVKSSSVAWGDYNNDGFLDILLTGNSVTSGNNYISKIYKNNGNNTFTEQTSIVLAGVRFGSVAWGDYNNDGYLDILLSGNISVLSNYTTKIYKNNGNNSFTEQTGIVLDGYARGKAAWGDLNNDGYLDLIVTGDSPEYVAKGYRNNGNNTFSDLSIPIPYLNSSSVALGDADNDGDLDFIISGQKIDGSTLITELYLNNGSASFTKATTVLTGVMGNHISWVDYDNNNTLDIFVSGYNDVLGNVSKIYKCNIAPANQVPSAPINLGTSINGTDITFMWDKAADKETSQNGLSYNLYVYEEGQTNYVSTPDANTTTGKRIVAKIGNIRWNKSGYTLKGIYVTGKTYNWSVQAIDAALAGGVFGQKYDNPSISSFTPTTGTIGTSVTITGTDFSTTPENNIVYFGAVKATVTAATINSLTVTVPAGAGSVVPISVETGGLIAYSSTSSTPFFNLTNTPNLVPQYSISSKGVGQFPRTLAISDFNSDGKSDIVTVNYDSHNVSILLGDGTGGFATATNFATGNKPYVVAVGDFNSDGKVDIVTANINSHNVSILLGVGDGSFATATNFATDNNPSSVVVADFSGDGKADIAVGCYNSISILLGDGTGNFGTRTNLAAQFAFSMAVGDFNGDRQTDIAAICYYNHTVNILLGEGAGKFSTAVSYPVWYSPRCIVVADFNNDGKPDIATSNYDESIGLMYDPTNSLSILLGDGNGGFGAATHFTVATNMLSIAAGDFNGDGKVDIATIPDMKILLGNGTGGFAAATTFTEGTFSEAIAVGDFNGDGKADVAKTCQQFNDVKIFLYAPAAPEVDVKQSTTAIADGSGSYDFGIQNTNTNTDIVFTIENTGSGASALGSFTISGTNANQFSLQGTNPTTVSASGTTTFTVRFTPTSAGAKTATVSFANDDADENPYNFTITSTATNITTWDGAAWSNGIPDALKDAIIAGNYTENVNIVCKDLTINNSVALTINPTITLTVNGTLTNNNGDAGLIIKSDATGSGSLIHSTASVPATVERFIVAEKWHYFSIPRQNMLINQITPHTLGVYMKDHNSNTGLWTNLGGSNTLQTGKGYSVWKSLTVECEDWTMNIAGNLNSGSVNIPVDNIDNPYGWNLIGNPYPSAIDWELVDRSGSNVLNTTYFWNGTAYSVYQGGSGGIPGVGTNGATQYIPAVQGFFVRTTATGTLTMTNAAREHNTQSFFRESQPFAQMRMSLTTNGIDDETVLRFFGEASNSFDDNYDAAKLFATDNTNPEIYSISNGESYAINSLPSISEDISIQVGIKTNATQPTEFSISAGDVSSFNSGIYIYLEDLQESVITDLNIQNAYTFTAQGDQPNRFVLRFTMSPVSVNALNMSNVKIYSYQNTIFVKNLSENEGMVQIYNMLGEIVNSEKLKKTSTATFMLPTQGTYLVKVTCNGKVETKRVFVGN